MTTPVTQKSTFPIQNSRQNRDQRRLTHCSLLFISPGAGVMGVVLAAAVIKMNRDRIRSCSELPDEMLGHVFSFLTVKSLKTCALVCKRWLFITKDPLVKKKFFFWNYPNACPEHFLEQPISSTWKFAYQQFEAAKFVEHIADCGSFRWNCRFAVSQGIIVSSSANLFLRAWDLKTRKCLQEYKEAHFGVSSIAIEDTTVISGSHDSVVLGTQSSTIKIWDFNTGVCRQSLDAEVRYVEAVAIQRDIVCGGCEGSIKIWDLRSGDCIQTLRGTGYVKSVAIQNDTIVSGGRDQLVDVWDLKKGQCIYTLVGHQAAVTCIAIQDDFIASGCNNGVVRVWSLDAQECLHIHRDLNSSAVNLFIKEDVVVSQERDLTVRVWDLAAGSPLYSFKRN